MPDKPSSGAKRKKNGGQETFLSHFFSFYSVSLSFFFTLPLGSVCRLFQVSQRVSRVRVGKTIKIDGQKCVFNANISRVQLDGASLVDYDHMYESSKWDNCLIPSSNLFLEFSCAIQAAANARHDEEQTFDG